MHCTIKGTAQRPEELRRWAVNVGCHGATQPHSGIARTAAGDAAAEFQRRRRASAGGESGDAIWLPLSLLRSVSLLTHAWDSAELMKLRRAAMQELMESVQRVQAGGAPAAGGGQLEVFPEPG